MCLSLCPRNTHGGYETEIYETGMGEDKVRKLSQKYEGRCRLKSLDQGIQLRRIGVGIVIDFSAKARINVKEIFLKDLCA